MVHSLQQERRNVINGPSRWDLMLALFDTDADLDQDNNSNRLGRTVKFEIDRKCIKLPSRIFPVAIFSVFHWGTGEVWEITGEIPSEKGGDISVSIAYSSRKRKGEIVIGIGTEHINHDDIERLFWKEL